MRFLALLLSVALVGCANLSLNDVYQNPSFQYESTKIADVNFKHFAGDSAVRISNSNPYQLPISSLNAQLWLEGKPWVSLDNDAISGLPANGDVVVNFQWDLIFDQLLTRAINVYQAGEAEFTLTLEPTVAVPVLGPQELKWSSTFTVPVPKLPKLALKDWRLTSASFTSVALALDIEVFNPNVFSVVTDNLNLDVGKDGKSLAALKMNDASIAAAGTSVQTVELSLSILDVGLALANSFKSGTWPDALSMNWQGNWASPELDFDLPKLSGQL